MCLIAFLDEFEAKYQQENPLGEGGYGSVFAGYRKADNLPVAIKYVKKIIFFEYTDDGEEMPAEVAVMLRLQARTDNSVGKSAPVTLLDWYELEGQLVLVLERPESAVSLSDYVSDHGGALEEAPAKVILQQLVDAAIYLQKNCIFHRDIKLENILIETDSEKPQLRLIDFGLSCFYDENTEFDVCCGILSQFPPEVLNMDNYSAGPGTVWQIGVVLYEMLHTMNFVSTSFIQNKLRIRKKLSKRGQDFLKKCLAEDPMKRPTLEDLQSHQWLRYDTHD
ncbi:serine/threonine-protein kinase pim-1-like [Melanotaenia boesemani]|uniref:serine/threonine-protein kinase pim-1-like n=1 Tax=Melanotaenia boesemani TaxID=1250792 RepID=UPI001C03B1BF|nr:serine/threonine-protein kinase pim-1-like [Melanotaenia boesemani]